MNFVRPEVKSTLSRWGEIIIMGLLAALGVWISGLGGLFFKGLGLFVVAAAIVLGLIAWRRMQFQLTVDAPGVVEVDEARISYLGPVFGGSIDLGELQELQVVDVAGRRRCWRFRQADGQALLVPFAAEGAANLFDTLSLLPGMRTAILSRATEIEAPDPVTIWSKPTGGS